MAGNKNSGKGPTLKVEYDDFVREIERYKADTRDGTIYRPSLADFCTRLGTNEIYLLEWLRYGDKQSSAYYRRAEALKNLLCWLRAQMLSTKAYDTPAGKKAAEMQLSKDHGDGWSYMSKEDKPQASTVKILFGNGEADAREAGK